MCILVGVYYAWWVLLTVGVWCLVFCSVPEFEASQYLVTNGQFLEFVESGGYQNRDLWTDEGQLTHTALLAHSEHTVCLGWKWVEFRCARHPTFWVCSEGCKSGCGSDLSSYSHCNLQNSPQNGTHTYYQ